MLVSGLNSDGDWRFGRGRAAYLKDAEAVRQNVVTRLKSFKRDCYTDTEANIDWVLLLGSRGTKNTIEREVERVVLSTDGVTTITELSINVSVSTRAATIMLSFNTIFDRSFSEKIGITL